MYTQRLEMTQSSHSQSNQNMPTDKEYIRLFAKELSGQFAKIGWRVDVISRITLVHLTRADGSVIHIGNDMVDIAERQESGQIHIQKEPEKLTPESPATIDFAPKGIALVKLWFVDTDIGTLVTGLSFLDVAGSEIQIATAAEVCCLFVSVGPFKSTSEPEYKDSAYRVVSI